MLNLRKGGENMCSPMMGVTLGMQAISGAMQAKGQYEQGKAEEQAYKHQAAVNEQNAKLAQVSADNARQGAMIEEEKSGKQFEQLMGTQRAVMAANGLDGGSVTNSMVLQDTAREGAEEATWIRHQGMMKKWGFQNEQHQHLRDADMNRAAGKNARKAGKMNALGTLLGTAANMAMTGYQMGGTKGTTGTTAQERANARVKENLNRSYT